MGLFQSRPEEPTEWAGLPSEPWEPRSAAEALAPPSADPSGLPPLDLFGNAPGGGTIAYTVSGDDGTAAEEDEGDD